MVDNKFECKLDEHSIQYLREILGIRIISIFSPWLNVRSDNIESSSFSISLKGKTGGWLNVANKRHETPEENDYYELSISKEKAPKGIKLLKDGALLSPVSQITYNHTPKITKIEVYSKIETWNGETLSYDYALVFFDNETTVFIIYVEETIGETLGYQDDKNGIEEVKSWGERRVVIR